MKTRKNRLPPFLPLLVDMLDAPATKALSHGAFRLYVALKRQYNPDFSDRRNGRVLSLAAASAARNPFKPRRDCALVSRTSTLRLHRDDGTAVALALRARARPRAGG